MTVIGRRWTISNVMDGAYDVSGPVIPRGESVEVVEVVDGHATTTQGAAARVRELAEMAHEAEQNSGKVDATWLRGWAEGVLSRFGGQ